MLQLSLSLSLSVMRRAQKNECLTICFSSYINHRVRRDAPWQISQQWCNEKGTSNQWCTEAKGVKAK